MAKVYRNGAIGALMDEYERAAGELISLLQTLSQETYVAVLDAATPDPDCRSVQSIMNHVVRAGYGYSNYIRKQYSDPFTERKETYDVQTPDLAIAAMHEMLAYTLDMMQNKWDLSFEEILKNVIDTNWKQRYDFDQLMEHAIVHILRHRRQIERLLSKN